MAIATFKRYEKKFLLDDMQYKTILPGLMQYMRHDAYCRDAKDYTIYNIYFDTADSSIIRESLSKPYYKEKLRLRSYSIPTSSTSPVFLELKKKIGGIVNKRRASLTLGEANNFFESGIIPHHIDYINMQVLNEISYFLENHPVKPAVYISYDRAAWFGKEDHEFRITFDRNIITRRSDLKLEKGRFGEDLLKPGEHLMEVKVSGAFPVWLAHLLSENQIYKASFSKYGKEYEKYLLGQETVSWIKNAV